MLKLGVLTKQRLDQPMTKRMSGVKDCSRGAVQLHVGAATSIPFPT